MLLFCMAPVGYLMYNSITLNDFICLIMMYRYCTILIYFEFYK